MKDLVTGGRGFIGSHLVEALDDPVVLDLKDGRDIRDNCFLYLEEQEYDIIYHLAALRSVPKSFDNPADYYSTNVWGTYNLLSKLKYRRFVNISSSSALTMLSPYGISKRCAEVITDSYPNAVTLRLFNVFGMGQIAEGTLILDTINRLKRGDKPLIYGTGQQTRDFTFVKDVIKQIIWYGNSAVSGIIDVGYGEERSVVSVVQKVANAMKYKGKFKYYPRRAGDQDRSCAGERFTVKTAGFDEGLSQMIRKEV